MVKKVGIIAAALCIAMAALTSCGKSDEGIALYIGTESVQTDEFMLFAARKKAETVRYFADKYGAEYGNDFWTSDFDGESPQQYLSDAVVQQLTEIKMLQKLAKKEDVMKSNSYSDLIATMQKANEQRKKQKENGEPVYGVVEYTPYEYYSDSIAKLRISLKEKLKEKLDPDEDTLREYYEKIKDVYYKKSEECKLTVYSFPQDLAAEALTKLAESGKNIKDTAEQLGAEIQQMETDYETDRYVSLYFPGLADEIKQGNTDTVHGPYLNRGLASFVVIDEIKDGGYKSFDEIESNVLSMYLEKYIDDKIESMTEKAKIKYTDEYNGISFSGL